MFRVFRVFRVLGCAGCRVEGFGFRFGAEDVQGLGSLGSRV